MNSTLSWTDSVRLKVLFVSDDAKVDGNTVRVTVFTIYNFQSAYIIWQ